MSIIYSHFTKIRDVEKEEKYGPFSTAQMKIWMEQGYFKSRNAHVRRVGENEDFFPVEKAEFDLYD